MRKLKLELLAVESFEPSRADAPARGTVQGHAWTRFDPTCGGISCDYACITIYDATCPNVCP